MNYNIKHLAILMDGNARWANANNLTKAEGHKQGIEVAKKLIPVISEIGIPYLTLYAFSWENWQRPAEEINVLMKLLSFYIQSETNNLYKNGIKLRFIGNLEKLSLKLRDQIYKAVELTKDNNKMTLCVAFSYGSRTEIIDACQKIINAGISKVNEEVFRKFLYDPEMPDVDLIIRPSGEYRISNFLLWQAAYAEFYFSQKFWPEFDKEELNNALESYSKRVRRFGSR